MRSGGRRGSRQGRSRRWPAGSNVIAASGTRVLTAWTPTWQNSRRAIPMPSNSAGQGAPAEVLEIVRTFEAPRPLLFRLWADPAHRVRWWGPEGYGLSHCEVDFRVGGVWSVAMR